MTKNQFLCLLITSVTLVTLTSVNLYLQTGTQKLNSTAQYYQNFILQSRSSDGPLQNLATRVATDSDKEPRLKEILAKNHIKTTLNVDGQERKVQ